MSAELCSLVFQSSDTSTAQLVGTSLFADGACSLLVTPESTASTFKIVEWRSSLIPNSRHVMGYDLKDTGLHLRLNQTLPDTLASSFKDLSAGFLLKHGLGFSDVQHWLFHPGSVKIVDMLADSIGLRPEQAVWAKDVLRDYGNMSSATILFVLERFLRTSGFKKGDRAVIAGVGPGLTVELILLEAQIDAKE
jgi:alkylresorcinol/alkylpyrone synthase